MCTEDHTPATTLILSRPPLWSWSLSPAELVSPLVCCSRMGLGRRGSFFGLLGCWQNLVPATVGLVFIFLLTVAQRQPSVGYISTQSSLADTGFLIHLLCQSKQEKKIDIAIYAITSSLELSVNLAIFHWLESSHGSSHTQEEMLCQALKSRGLWRYCLRNLSVILHPWPPATDSPTTCETCFYSHQELYLLEIHAQSSESYHPNQSQVWVTHVRYISF